MQPDIFRTRSLDLAVFLRYALPHSHLYTVREFDKMVFTFEGLDQCKELSNIFHGREPVAIGDLRAFNAASRALRKTMRIADAEGGWYRDPIPSEDASQGEWVNE